MSWLDGVVRAAEQHERIPEQFGRPEFFVRVSFFCASMLVTAAVGGIMFRGLSVRLKHSFERDISGTPQRNFPHLAGTIRLDSGIS